MAIDLATAAPEAFKTASASQPLIPPSPPSLPTIHSPMIYNARLALHLQKDYTYSPTLHVSIVQKSTTYIPIPPSPRTDTVPSNQQVHTPRRSMWLPPLLHLHLPPPSSLRHPPPPPTPTRSPSRKPARNRATPKSSQVRHSRVPQDRLPHPQSLPKSRPCSRREVMCNYTA